VSLLVGIAARPKDGEIVSGDATVSRQEGGRHLLAVIDGLGHGVEAHAAAAEACAYLEQVDLDRPIDRMIQDLHERLRATRGAAALVLVVSEARVVGCGVGNVDMRTRIGRIQHMLTPGVLGARLRKPKIFEGDLGDRDRIALFSDGIASSVDLEGSRDEAPAVAARSILAKYGRHYDDATVLVADRE